MIKKPLKLKIFAVLFMFIFAIILLAGLELISNYSYEPKRLDKILAVLNPHPKLFWTGKPNYKGNFFGRMVHHNKDGFRHYGTAKDIDILILGASPSYGWGVKHSKTYSSIIENELKKLGVNVKVLNASTIGYSSFQGKLLLKKLLKKLTPKVVIISYLINDIDHYRFFRNLPINDASVQGLTRIGRIQEYLNTEFTLQKSFNNIFSRSREETLSKPGAVRVSLSSYKLNLLDMVSNIRSAKAIPILLKFPVELYENVKRQSMLELLDKTKCKNKLSLGDHFLKCLANNKVFSSSNFTQNQKRKLIAIYSSKRIKKYQSTMDNISNENNVLLIDAAKVFEKQEEYLFLSKKDDPIHPNPKGHQIIGRLITKELFRLLN